MDCQGAIDISDSSHEFLFVDRLTFKGFTWSSLVMCSGGGSDDGIVSFNSIFFWFLDLSWTHRILLLKHLLKNHHSIFPFVHPLIKLLFSDLIIFLQKLYLSSLSNFIIFFELQIFHLVFSNLIRIDGSSLGLDGH